MRKIIPTGDNKFKITYRQYSEVEISNWDRTNYHGVSTLNFTVPV